MFEYFYVIMQDFFKKHGVSVMSVKELFDFIIDSAIADDVVDDYLEKVIYFLKMYLSHKSYIFFYIYHLKFDIYILCMKIYI